MYNFKKESGAPTAAGAGDEEVKLPTPEPEETNPVHAPASGSHPSQPEEAYAQIAVESPHTAHHASYTTAGAHDEEPRYGEDDHLGDGDEEDGDDDDEESSRGSGSGEHSSDGDDGGDDDDDGDDDAGEDEEEEEGGGVKSHDGQALSGLARTQRSAHVIDKYSPPSLEQGATGSEVLMYFRRFVESFNVTPPREWRQIRFDLPATVAELKLYPPTQERMQRKHPVQPTTTLIMNLEGLMPADTSVEDYTVQMIQYMFDVLQYVNATTAMTSVRFVKKGALVTQMVVTLGRDRALAMRVLKQIRSAGIPVGYGQPTHLRDMQPNATFQVRDYKFLLHDGRGIASDDVLKFLTPFRTSAHDADILVVDGFEPGLFFAPVKRPETVFSFLWNPTVSILLQRFLFEKLGVLVTQASCPHEFLQKGVPYYIQKQQKEMEKQLQLEEKAKKDRSTADAKATRDSRRRREDGELDADDAENQDGYERSSAVPAWARDAAQAIDIFGFGAVAGHESTVSSAAPAKPEIGSYTPAAPPGRPPYPSAMAPLTPSYHTSPYGSIAPPGVTPVMPYGGATGVGVLAHSRGDDGGEEDGDRDPGTNDDTATATGASGSSGPTRRYQLAKLDPSEDMEEEEGRNGASAGTLFFTDVDSALDSTDVFRHLLEPRGRAAKAAKAAAETTTEGANEADRFAGMGRGDMPPPPLPIASVAAPPPVSYGDPYARHEPLPPPPASGHAALFPPPPPMLREDGYGGPVDAYRGGPHYPPPSQGFYGGDGPDGALPPQYYPTNAYDASYPQGDPYAYGPQAGHYYNNDFPPPPQMPLPPPPGESYSVGAGSMLPPPPVPSAAQAPVAGGGGILGNAYMPTGGMTTDEADRLVVTIEEHLRSSFPREFDAYMARVKDVDYLQPDGQECEPADEAANVAQQNAPVMAHVTPEKASLPYRSDELDALTSHVETEYVRIVQLLESRYVNALAEPRRRLLHCLLFALPAAEQAQDWIPRAAEDDDDDDDRSDGENGKKPEVAPTAAYVPALLPYCLTSDEGTAVVRAMLQLYPRHVAPLLARYVLPFLLDSDVVAAICVPLLHYDPRAENALVTRLLQHWSRLAAWLQEFVVAEAKREATAQVARDHRAPSSTDDDAAERAASLEVSTKAARKRLASQVGNTLEQVLMAMSVPQRLVVRRWSETHKLLESAFGGAKGAVDLATSLWEEEGAVTRTLLRLYLSTDTFDGRHLLEVLHSAFGSSRHHTTGDKAPHGGAHTIDSEAFFYFARALVAPGRMNAVLSRETAAFCGAYARVLERQLTANTPSQADTTATFKLTEKEVVQLVTTAVKALEEASSAAAAAAAQPFAPAPAFADISAAAVAFEALRVAYNTPLSSEATGATHTHLPAVVQVIEKAQIAGPVTAPLLPQGPGGLMPPPPLPGSAMLYPHVAGGGTVPGFLSNGSALPAQPEAVPLPPPPPQSELEARWQTEWTRKMNLYPAIEEPFTPLPTGWSSSLSRSYGHYYFKPPGNRASPTYKHPTDATEFMATPQAFLREPGTATTLEQVRAKANALLAADSAAAVSPQGANEEAAAGSPAITERISAEDAAAWFADQRKRSLGLDVATLELLKVHYRLGGQRRSQRDEAGAQTAAGASTAKRGEGGAAPPAVARRVEHTEEELAALLARSVSARQHYPAKGYPFPGLFKGWTVNMSALNGLYTFHPPRASMPTIRHPQNRHYYRATPQAFAAHRELTPEAIAAATHGAKTVDEVRAWLADQRTRDRVLDKTVCDMVSVHYMAIPDIDEPRGDSARSH